MAEYLPEQLGNLLKKLSVHLHRKASEIVVLLFSNKGAGSLGALAGFAIAIVFTWKFLRSSPRSDRHKRTNPGASTSGVDISRESAPNSDLVPSQSILTEPRVADSKHQIVELSPAQVLKKRLNGARKITCQLLGVLLEEKTSEELQKSATVRHSSKEILLEIAKSCDVYLMETIDDDLSEEIALGALEKAGVFDSGLLMREKVLFCGTENGRASFVRQLEPDWHIDTNPAVIKSLSRFIRFQLHVGPTGSTVTAANIFSSLSLEQYFSHAS